MRARVERQTDERFRQQFDKLYRENQPKIFRVACGVTGNHEDAEEVVQNVFLKLIEAQPSPDFIKDPPRYLCRAAVHEAVSMFRFRQREKLVDEDLTEVDVPSEVGIWGGDGDSERLEDLEQSLKVARDQLNPYLAALVTLRYDLDCKVADIAKIFRRTRFTIGMHLMRARRELKRLMSTPGGTQ